MKPLAKLGEKFAELAKKLGKRFKPKKGKKTKVGGNGKGDKSSGAGSKKDKKNGDKNKQDNKRDKAVKITEDADKPLEPVNPNKSQHGHGHAEHGHQTTEAQQENRIVTGVKPSGE